jgi:DME family drug/metabolite transporter
MRISMTVPAAARRRPSSGLPYLVMSGLLWGTGGLTGSLLHRVANLSAISVAACRLTVGGVLIVVLLMVTGRRWPAGRAAWTGRRTGRLAVGTTSLALLGLGLLVGLPSGFGESAVLASAGMAVLAAAGFVAVTLTASRAVPGLDDLTAIGFGFTIGGPALIPLAATVGGLSFRPGPAAIGLLIALGTGPTAVAYTLYFRGLRTAAASTAALLSLLEPLTGAVLATFVLGERLSVTGIAGAAVLATAVILTVCVNRARGVLGDAGASAERTDGVGSDDGGDAQLSAPRQRLAQDHQSDDRGQDWVDAHEDPEGVGWNPAQREQVDEKRDRRGQDSRSARARQGGDGGRVPDCRYVGITPESTVTQYPRPGVVYRPMRDAPPVPVRLVWWQDDAHPAAARPPACLPISIAAGELAVGSARQYGPPVLRRSVTEGGHELVLAIGAQAGTSRPVQALFAFPRQHVGQQLGPRPVPQPSPYPGLAAAGAKAFPARLGYPHRERFRTRELSDFLLSQPPWIRQDELTGVPACRTGLLDPGAERDHRADRVIDSRGPGLSARQDPYGQVTDVDHLRRLVWGGGHEHWPLRVTCRSRHPVTGAPAVVAGSADHPSSRDQ